MRASTCPAESTFQGLSPTVATSSSAEEDRPEKSGPSDGLGEDERKAPALDHSRLSRTSSQGELRWCDFVRVEQPRIRHIVGIGTLNPFHHQLPNRRQERSRWRGGRFASTSLRHRWSLEELTVARYADVNMDWDASSISMSINNRLLTQLLSMQQLPNQSRFKSHSTTRPPQTPAASF